MVTCGILIALGLEGIRESVHDRHLVRETREKIRFEMEANLKKSGEELARVSQHRDERKARAEAMKRLILLQRSEQSLVYVGQQMQDDVRRALAAAHG